ncbi:MAG: hypothetical protein E5X14_19345, partial [Mesorhizobium sp.]
MRVLTDYMSAPVLESDFSRLSPGLSRREDAERLVVLLAHAEAVDTGRQAGDPDYRKPSAPRVQPDD